MTIGKTRCVKYLSPEISSSRCHIKAYRDAFTWEVVWTPPEISQNINFRAVLRLSRYTKFWRKNKTQESVDILERFSIVSKVRVCFCFALLCCVHIYAFFAHDVINRTYFEF